LSILKLRVLAITACALLLTLLSSCGGDSAPSDSPTPAEDARTGLPEVSEIVFTGNLKEMVIVPGQGNSASAAKDDEQPAVRLSSIGAKRPPEGDGNGGIVRLTPALSRALSGRKVMVTISMKTSPTAGSPAARVLYSRPGLPTSGWRELMAGAEFKDATFEYTVPTREGGHGPDLISIWADPEGRDRAVEIRKIEIKSAAN
jgi:hypothetical protein